MANLTQLEIARVHFALDSDNQMAIEEPDPAYLPFCQVHGGPGTVKVRIHLIVGNAPDTDKLAHIFSSQSWSMFQNGGDCWLTFASPVFERAAQFGRDLSRATIYCGRELAGEQAGVITLLNPMRYPLDQILLMYALAPRQGVLLHAAGAELDGQGLLFLGKSGAGKSTLAGQLVARGIHVLSDDRMAVRKIDGAFRTFGTPWPGDARIAANEDAPLRGLFFIRHGTSNQIKELSPRQAFERIAPVASIPWYDPEVLLLVLDGCNDLVTHVPAFDLYFCPTPDAAEFLREFVRRET